MGKNVPENRNIGSSRKVTQFRWWNVFMYDVTDIPSAAKAKATRTAAGMASTAHGEVTTPNAADTTTKPTA